MVFYFIHAYLRRRRRRNAAITSSVQWSGPNFRDGGSTEINFAPKRGSLQYSDDDNIAPYADAIVPSSMPTDYAEQWSSTVATRSADRVMNEQIVQNSFSGPVDIYDYNDNNDTLNLDEQYSLTQIDVGPQIDIGPPIDEDGHELHNVEII
jgi:hypothetical protein